MNLNIGLFEEDRLSLGDMNEWNVDSVFSGDDPPESNFDLSKATHDFLEPGSAFQNSSAGMVPPTTSAQQTTTNHISPRGIADIVEQETSCERAGEHSSNPKQGSPATTGTDTHDGNSPQSSLYSQYERYALEENENSGADRNNTTQIPSNENSPKQNELVKVEITESPTYASEEIGGPDEPVPQQPSDPLREPVSEADIEAALHGEIPFNVNEESIEFPGTAYGANNKSSDFPGTGYGVSNVTSDAIESLMQLPDHVQFNGEIDQLLHPQSMGPVAEDAAATQQLLQLQMQAPHQELINNPVHATPQVDLSSNMVIGNYEPSSTYHTEPEHDQGPNGMSSVPNASSFLQVQAGIPGPNNIMSPPNMHMNNQTLQEVVQAYQSNIHPTNLQSQLTSNYGTHGQAFGTSVANSHAPLSPQAFLAQHYAVPSGPNQGISLGPSQRIVKRRGRKGPRDPTKPPLTPRRKKGSTSRGKKGKRVLGPSPDAIASSALQRNYGENVVAQPSTAPLASGLSAQFRPPLTERQAISAAGRAPTPTTSEIQRISGPGQSSGYRQPTSRVNPKNATASGISKVPRKVDSGRIAKKPGKKGGRINPETAHLSVEERRSLRAKRNRESAEKSRVRRKVQTAELEMSVAELRNENKSLKSEALQFQAQLSAMSLEVTKHTKTPAEREQFLREHAPALFQSLIIVQRVINECPRTFRPHPHAPEIQLKIRR